MWRHGLRVGLVAGMLLGGGSAGAAEPAAEASGGIWGTVRANGSPVVGARVTVHRTVPSRDLHDPRATFDVLDLLYLEAAPAATVVTDGAGLFTAPDLAPGYYVVEAAATEGSACGLSLGLLVERSAWTPIAVSLEPSSAVEGRILEADATPYLGLVLLARVEGYDGDTPRHVCRSASTDERGAFRIDRVPPGRWRAFAARPGREWASFDAFDLDGPRTLALEVPASAPRRVRVVDAEGRPVVGARIAADYFGGGWMCGGVTDREGSVLLSRRGSGAMRLLVDPPGHVAWDERIEAGTGEVRIVPAPTRLTGRVVGRVEREDGTPAEGVAITVMEGGDGYLVRRGDPVLSGADGSFIAPELEPGLVWLALLGAGYAGARMSNLDDPPLASKLFQVPVGGDVARTVRVRRAASLEGVVVDGDGRPVAGALLRWRDGIDFAPAAEAWVATGADGAFRIRTLPAGITVSLSGSAPGAYPDMTSVDVGAPGSVTRGARIVLPRARFLSVRVRIGGAPAAGAIVRASGESSGLRSGSDGRVVLGPLPRTRLELQVSHPESPQNFDAIVPPGGDEALDADLPKGLSIAGRVVDDAGMAVGSVSVWADPRIHGVRSRRVYQRTDERGEFRFGGLAPGTWRLTVDSQTGTTLDVPAGAADVTLHLAPHAAEASGVEVHVVGPDGRPVPFASIRWITEGESGDGYVTDGVKKIEMEGGGPSEGMTIEVTNARDAKGNPLPFDRGRVGPLRRDDRKVEIRLSQGRAISGRVTAPLGASVEGVEVVAVRVSGKDAAPLVLASSKVSADGAFTLYGAGDEKAALFVRSRGRDETLGLSTRVTARAGDIGVNVPLVARVAATVIVLEADGRGAAKAEVLAQRTDDPLGSQDGARAHTDLEGRVRLEGLVPGATYRLYAIHESGRTMKAADPWAPADTVVRFGPAALVRGVVQNGAGIPVPGAFVLAMADGKWVGMAGSEADGTFRMAVPAVGTVDVQAFPEFDPWSKMFAERDLGSPVAAAVASGASVTLVVGTGVRASVRIVGETDPDAWADISAQLTREKEPWDPEAATGYVRIEHGGTVPLPPLLAGARYRFWLPAGRTGRCALVSLTASEGLVLDVRPVDAGSVRGRVRLPEGSARVFVRVEGHGFLLLEDAGADGTFVVEGVPNGEPFDVVAITRVAGAEWTARVASRAGAEVVLEPSAPRPR